MSRGRWTRMWCFFFFQAEDGIRDRNVTGVQTCALPIFKLSVAGADAEKPIALGRLHREGEKAIEASGIGWTFLRPGAFMPNWLNNADRKSTRLNSSHVSISYAVFCLKK